MHIHVLGVCGTFMGSLAQLAKALGHRVTGSDTNVYPPMSTQLSLAGIELIEGFGVEQLALAPDVYVVGNVIARGNPLMEEILNRGLPYISGPDWLAQHLLRGKWVLGVAGTHGKTTTSTMLAWILEYAGYAPGYLIGGVPGNFEQSARLGGSDFFVIEADEYDTAFFDKRSKFIHYQPKTLVINNLEYDHADIFDSLLDIQKQFHHVLRTVPSIGQVIYPEGDTAIEQVVAQGCWSSVSFTGSANGWQAQKISAEGGCFNVLLRQGVVGQVQWDLSGDHNVNNALAALAAAYHVGVEPAVACAALCEFKGVKRRMELVGEVDGVKVYDDFAHHPTAIATTLAGLRKKVGDEPIYAVLEPRSNTMKRGVFQGALRASVSNANKSYWYCSAAIDWDLAAAVGSAEGLAEVLVSTDAIIQRLIVDVKPQVNAHIVVMSNGGFEAIHERLLAALQEQAICSKQ